MGRPNPSRETDFSDVNKQRKTLFSCRADHERDLQSVIQVDPYSAESSDVALFTASTRLKARSRLNMPWY